MSGAGAPPGVLSPIEATDRAVMDDSLPHTRLEYWSIQNISSLWLAAGRWQGWWGRDLLQRGRQLRRPLSVHVADGGSISGGLGVKSRDADGSSTCSFRSAAFSIKAAEILGSVVALANLNKIAA